MKTVSTPPDGDLSRRFALITLVGLVLASFAVRMWLLQTAVSDGTFSPVDADGYFRNGRMLAQEKVVAHAGIDLPFIASVVLAPLGAVLARRSREAGLMGFWVVLMVVLTAFSAYGGVRYRSPFEPHLIALASVVLAPGCESVAQGRCPGDAPLPAGSALRGRAYARIHSLCNRRSRPASAGWDRRGPVIVVSHVLLP